MWSIMLHRELEYVPCLVRSEITAINSSPWRNPLLLVNSAKVFFRTVDGKSSKQPKCNVLTTFRYG